MIISRVAIHRTSATIGLVYGFCALLFVPIILLGPASDEGTGKFALALPLIFAAGTYLMIAALCVLYNLVSRWTGGIEFTVQEGDSRAV